MLEIANENERIENECEKHGKDVKTQLNFYKWLNGKMKFKVNGLASCLTEKSKLLNQVRGFVLF